MRLIYGLCLFLLLLFFGAIRRRLPASLARLAMRMELPLAIHVRWWGGGMNSAADSYMQENGAAYGPAMAERLVTSPCGSLKARLVWVPLVVFLTDEGIRTRVREYAAHCGDPAFRAEMETALDESTKW